MTENPSRDERDAVTRWLDQARLAFSMRDYAHAAGTLSRLLEVMPDHLEAMSGMGAAQQQLGQLDSAEQWYEKVVARSANNASVLYNLALIRQMQGKEGAAESTYQQALAIRPDFFQALCNLGSLYFQMGRVDEALVRYGQALALQPKLVEAWYGMGMAYAEKSDDKNALHCLRTVVQLDPGHIDARFAFAVALQNLGLRRQAVVAYRGLLQLEPMHIDAWYNLGKAYQDEGNHAEAELTYRKALLLLNQAVEFPHATRLEQVGYNLGRILKLRGAWEEWRQLYLDLAPRCAVALPMAIYGLGVARYAGDALGEQRNLDTILKHAYKDADLDLLRLVLSVVHYFDLPREDVYSLYRRFDDLMNARVVDGERVQVPPRVAENGRIRVGYLSADYRHHVMGNMIAAIISRHDRSRFDIFCYSLGRHDDSFTEVFKRHADKFVAVHGLEPGRAAELIARDDLDILVDLSTHTQDANPEILAYKPARVLITHIASAGATGLSTIDFKLTDHFADTPDSQNFLIETLLPMEGCVFPCDRNEFTASPRQRDRAALGIAMDEILIGAFVNPMKLSPRCMRLWRAVLERIPRAKLAFSPMHDHEKPIYRSIARAYGISEDRYIFIEPGNSSDDKRSRYSLINFVLDTLPYGGVNGILEPLSMGVPVITLKGRTHGERTAFSILSNLGVTTTIAMNEDEYVALAARMASDDEFLHITRSAIRKGFQNSLLTDMDAHVRHLENAYLRALENKGLSPLYQG